MNGSIDALRRWLGLFFLAVAGGMVIWGQIVLDRVLTGWGFLLYWSLCLLFTLAAIFMALLDLRAVRLRTRREQRDLIEKTLEAAEQRSDHDPEPPAGDASGR